MFLRIRRGSDSQRRSIVPLDGELVYANDTKKVFIGDGVTQGGVPISNITTLIFPDETNRNASLLSPIPGTMVYISDISKFQGYVDDDGTGNPGWVNLN